MGKVINFETQNGKFAFIETEPPILTDEGVDFKFSANVATRNYDIIGIAQLITNNQWSEIVDSEIFEPYGNVLQSKKLYFNYLETHFAFETATKSGKSLMQSLGIENGTWVIIKYKPQN